MAQLQDQLQAQTEAVKKFLSATGHDLCHENRAELAAAFGLEVPPGFPRLPPENEFALRCVEYRKSLYGPDGPGSDQEVYETRIRTLERIINELNNSILVWQDVTRVSVQDVIIVNEIARKYDEGRGGEKGKENEEGEKQSAG